TSGSDPLQSGTCSVSEAQSPSVSLNRPVIPSKHSDALGSATDQRRLEIGGDACWPGGGNRGTFGTRSGAQHRSENPEGPERSARERRRNVVRKLVPSRFWSEWQALPR